MEAELVEASFRSEANISTSSMFVKFGQKDFLDTFLCISLYRKDRTCQSNKLKRSWHRFLIAFHES